MKTLFATIASWLLLVSANAVLAQGIPTMTVAFSPPSTVTNTQALLTITLTTPSTSVADTNASGTITFPAGLTAVFVNNLCPFTGANIAANVFSFSGGTIAIGAGCTVILGVQSTTPGSYTVSVAPGDLTSTFGTNTNSSSDTLTVTAPPPTTLSVSSSALDFGTSVVSPCCAATQTVTVINTGPNPLQISSLT
ncbi:MAG: hypothetical protein WCL29_09290, partial [Pseudomonadota bacterium]